MNARTHTHTYTVRHGGARDPAHIMEDFAALSQHETPGVLRGDGAQNSDATASGDAGETRRSVAVGDDDDVVDMLESDCALGDACRQLVQELNS